METSPMFRVNYYVGTLLAQGGNVWIHDSKIVFSPTSAIDRAMGAKDVEITFKQIKEVQNAGGLFRSFTVKTEEKTHKFEGGQAQKFWEHLQKALVEQPRPAVLEASKNGVENHSEKRVSAYECDQCGEHLEPYYSFCPHCATRLKSACNSCKRAIDPLWAACAFCGWKFKNLSKAA